MSRLEHVVHCDSMLLTQLPYLDPVVYDWDHIKVKALGTVSFEEDRMLQHICFTYGFNLNLAKRLVGDLTPEQMCGQPYGVVNHPAWSLGHLAGA